MGHGSISHDSYSSLQTSRLASTGVKAFSHQAAIQSGQAPAQTHSRLNMTAASVVLNGNGVREARDSDEHPESNALVVMFDVTGSMGKIPRVLQEKLVKLPTTLLTKGFLSSPQILFAAIGDAYTDRAPLQIGQFESNVNMDEDLDKIYLEGNGGGQGMESYDLGLYFAAYHTAIDCFEKRGKKGYLFLIGDESPYDQVLKAFVDKHIGKNTLEGNMTIEQVVKKAEEKYELFFVCATESGYGDSLMGPWKKLLGERVLKLDDASLVCELIVTTIGMNEGYIDSAGDLVNDLGLNGSQVSSIDNALIAYKPVAGKNQLATASASGTLTKGSDQDNVDNI